MEVLNVVTTSSFPPPTLRKYCISCQGHRAGSTQRQKSNKQQTNERGFSEFKKGAAVEEIILEEVLVLSVWLAVGYL